MSGERETVSARGFELLRVGGLQLAVDWSWFAIFVLVLWSLSAGYFPAAVPGYGVTAYWAIGLLATALLFASVVVHELSHAAVANRTGHPVRRCTLFVFGGMAHLTREARSPGAEIAIAAVGPLTSLAIGGFFALLARSVNGPALWVEMLRYLGVINVALAVFNLLPGLPLDGGRILRGVLWWRSGDYRRATATAAGWGGDIGLGLIVLGFLQVFSGALVGGMWLVFIGMCLRGAAGESYQAALLERTLTNARVGDLMIPDPVVVPGTLTVAQALEELVTRTGIARFVRTKVALEREDSERAA